METEGREEKEERKESQHEGGDREGTRCDELELEEGEVGKDVVLVVGELLLEVVLEEMDV